MINILNGEIQLHKISDDGKIAASFSGITVINMEEGGIIQIEMLEEMSQALRLEKELINDNNITFFMTFGENSGMDKKFKGVTRRCTINPFNCERTSLEAEIKICSDPENFDIQKLK